MVLRGLRALECPLEQHDEHHYYPYLEYAGISAGRWQCCPAGMSQIFFFLTFGRWLCTFLFWNPIINLQIIMVVCGEHVLLLSYEFNPVFVPFLPLAVLRTDNSLFCWCQCARGKGRKPLTSQ